MRVLQSSSDFQRSSEFEICSDVQTCRGLEGGLEGRLEGSTLEGGLEGGLVSLFGSYVDILAASAWNASTHSLLVWGPSNVGKLQYVQIRQLARFARSRGSLRSLFFF